MHQTVLTLLAGMILTGCAAGSAATKEAYITDPQAVLEKTWQWEATVTPVEKIEVDNPENYTLRLGADGRAQIRFDCNHGGGAFEVSPGKLAFGPLMSTRMACPPGSLDAIYSRDLQRVVSFFVKDSRLYLELPYDSGTMQFRPADE